MTSPAITAETVELLQTMIRNALRQRRHGRVGLRAPQRRHARAPSSATPASTCERFEPTPGRVSLVARIEGTRPERAEPVPDGPHRRRAGQRPKAGRRDPFGGELVDGDGLEVWGGAPSTCSTSPPRWLWRSGTWPRPGFRPEATSSTSPSPTRSPAARTARGGWPTTKPDAIRADYVLTENGGLHSGPRRRRTIGVNVGEKGVAWRRLRVRGTPGHGSMPYRSRQRAREGGRRRAAPRRVPARAEVPRAVARAGRHARPRRRDRSRRCSTRRAIDDAARRAAQRRRRRAPPRLHAHDVLAQRAAGGRFKTNMIPDARRPRGRHPHAAGRDADDVSAHLAPALGDLADAGRGRDHHERHGHDQPDEHAAVGPLERAVDRPFPGARLTPQLVGRLHRRPGLPARWARRLRRRAVQPGSTPASSAAASTATTSGSTSSRCA